MSKPAQVKVLYPRTATSTFNIDYYLSTHMPLVVKHWSDYGLKGYKVVSFDADAPWTYGCTLEFESLEGFEKAGQTEGAKTVMGDIVNFSNEKPVLAKGEVIDSK